MSNRHLSRMTWEEITAEMSIAGNPEKITQLGRDVTALIGAALDPTNRAEFTNVEFMLKCVMAQIRLYARMYDRTH